MVGGHGSAVRAEAAVSLSPEVLGMHLPGRSHARPCLSACHVISGDLYSATIAWDS